MDRKLYEASLTGNVQALNALIQQDQLILDRVSLATGFNETPLHIASLRGHVDLARMLLSLKPKLATSVDSLRRTPLHLASAEGHVEIVKELSSVSPSACCFRDQDGLTPLHMAAMNEQVEVMKVLIRAQPDVGRETVVRGESVLHFCVRYNRLEALMVLMESWSGDEAAKLIDDDGNTLLHLAAMNKQTETIKYLLSFSSIKANGNAVNRCGFTALDVVDHGPRDFKALEIREILTEAGVLRAKDLIPAAPTPLSAENISSSKKYVRISKNIHTDQKGSKGSFLTRLNKYYENNSNWVEANRGLLIVAAILFATMAFQTGMNPPGGTYLDSSNGHIRGTAVQADIDMGSFNNHVTLNAVILILSLTNVLMLITGFPFKHKFFMWLLMMGFLTEMVIVVVTYLVTVANMVPDIWINLTTFWICFVWIIVCALFGLFHTVYIIVWFVTKKRMSKASSATYGPASV